MKRLCELLLLACVGLGIGWRLEYQRYNRSHGKDQSKITLLQAQLWNIQEERLCLLHPETHCPQRWAEDCPAK
jgi:hypothetical protein